MVGTEFVVDGRPEKAKPLVKEIVHAAEKNDLLLLTCGTYDNVIRWIPPLNVTSGQVNDALTAFAAALKDCSRLKLGCWTAGTNASLSHRRDLNP